MVKLDQAEFIDIGSLNRKSEYNAKAWGISKGYNGLFG